MNRLEEIKKKHELPLSLFPGDATLHHEIRWLIEKLEKAIEVIKFYSEPKDINTSPIGTRIEFGCGCCAGTIKEEGLCSSNSQIIGLTAREFLKELE